MGKTYDPSVDYMKKMEEAAQKGDFEQAAYYEEKRNEKIKGEGLSQYTLTHNYEAYLPQTTKKKMEEIFQKLEAREPFSYDLQGDKLYAQYRDRYSQAGNLAKEDATAQAAALTGGYGNSYAVTLGQAAYDREMERLEALVPQLYDRAKEAYDAEGDSLMDQYQALAKELEQEEKLALEQEKMEQQRLKEEQQREQDRLAAAAKAEKEERDKAYSLALSMLNQGLMPSDELLDRSGLNGKDAQAIYGANQPKSAGGASGNGASSGSGGGKGNSTGGKQTSSGTGSSSAGNKGKDLTNTLWEKLRTAYAAGMKSGDLQNFYGLHSMMEAQGYNVSPFDTWARQTYGKDYSTGKEKTIHWQSVLDLGYGPIGEDRLQQLLAAGIIEQYTQGDYIYFKKAQGTPALPKGYGN